MKLKREALKKIIKSMIREIAFEDKVFQELIKESVTELLFEDKGILAHIISESIAAGSYQKTTRSESLFAEHMEPIYKKKPIQEKRYVQPQPQQFSPDPIVAGMPTTFEELGRADFQEKLYEETLVNIGLETDIEVPEGFSEAILNKGRI